jgi:hypothetical protein
MMPHKRPQIAAIGMAVAGCPRETYVRAGVINNPNDRSATASHSLNGETKAEMDGSAVRRKNI